MVAAAAAVLAGLVLLGGWAAGVDALKTFGGAVPTKANTAFSLLLCGSSLFLLADSRGRGARAARALATVAGVLGLVTLVEYATGHGLGIDELVFKDSTHTLFFSGKDHTVLLAPPGRMAPQTALVAALTAMALLGLDWRPRGWWPAGMLAAIVAVIATATLLGHIYSIASLYAMRPFIAMSGPTAAGFLLLAIGISCARPERGLVAALTADTTAGMLLRFLLPPALVVPVIVGTLILVGERNGLYDNGQGMSLLIVATILGCVTFAVAATRTLQSLDAERRKAGERLEDQTRRYKILVERLPLVTYTDKVDVLSTPIYVSPQVEATLGYTPEEWLADATLFERLVHPDDRECVMSGIARFRDTGEPFRCEYRLRAKGGHYVWILDETMQVWDQTRGSLYAQGYMRDITQRKEAERMRQRLEAELAHAQKLESVGQLAGGIAHDFNNLLGAIIAYLGFAEERARTNPDVMRDLAQIRRAAERGADLTDQLLVFSRKDVVRPRDIDLAHVVRETRELMHPLLGDDVTLRMHVSEDECPVEADPTQIQRILLNLGLNARAAMPDGGVIHVCVKAVDLAGLDVPPEMMPGRHVRLTVADTGCGMSSEVAARAFEPFFTTKPAGEGTGLGLATVYGIVTRLKGHVELETEPGNGTKVKILLPAVDAGVSNEEAVSVPPGLADRLVLVVDDDEALRASTSRILAANGYEVLEASDGMDALEKYERAQPRPAALVTDVVMPRMSGTELAEAVAAMEPPPKVIFMSGYAQGLEQVHPDFPLVAKPFTADVLLAVVSKALSAEPVSVGAGSS